MPPLPVINAYWPPQARQNGGLASRMIHRGRSMADARGSADALNDLRAAQAAVTDPYDICLVDLRPLSNPSLVMHRVAAVPRHSRAYCRAAARHARRQQEPKHVLLVPANLRASSRCLSQHGPQGLLRACKTMPLLATSREPLHLDCAITGTPGLRDQLARLDGEITWHVPSLASPDPSLAQSAPGLAEIARSPAVRLFISRAQSVDRYTGCHGRAPCLASAHRPDGLPRAPVAAGPTC